MEDDVESAQKSYTPSCSSLNHHVFAYFQRPMLAAPELIVQETESHRCDVCSGIAYEKFWAEDALAEFSKPKIVLIRSFLYISNPAFAGCWVCRLLLRQISQTATTLQATFNLYSIAMIGLRLNLDDELTVHFYDEFGHPIQLNDLQADVIDVRDGEWSETFRVEDAMEEKAKLEWDFDIFPPGLHDCGNKIYAVIYGLSY
jgi:hypothetical protein